jgi:hypothetical protein
MTEFSQGALFGDPPPQAHARTTDPHTSHEAAASLDPDTLTRSQSEVWEVLFFIGPSTDAALVTAYAAHAAQGSSIGGLAIRPQSVSGIRTRRAELAHRRRVVDTGSRVRLPSGRRAIVWRAVREDEL